MLEYFSFELALFGISSFIGLKLAFARDGVLSISWVVSIMLFLNASISEIISSDQEFSLFEYLTSSVSKYMILSTGFEN